MPGALVGARSCGRCGQGFDDRLRYCSNCGVLRVAPASGSPLGTYSGLLAGVQTAAPPRRRLSMAIDAVPLVGAVVAMIAAATGALGIADEARVGLVAGAALLMLLYIALTLTALARRGRSLGRWLLALRTVDDLTGRPTANAVAGFGSRADTVTTDLRRGRDPVTPGYSTIAALSPVGAAPPASGMAKRSPTSVLRALDNSPSMMLVLDTGERLLLETSLLIGRAPAALAVDQQPVFSWPDLSRSLSKTHARLEWTGTVLWVTDLHSTNGSALVSPDGVRQPLVPGIRGPAAAGWTIELGERRLAVHPSGQVDDAEPMPDSAELTLQRREDDPDGR